MTLSQRIASFFLLHALFLAVPFGLMSIDRATADTGAPVATADAPADVETVRLAVANAQQIGG